MFLPLKITARVMTLITIAHIKEIETTLKTNIEIHAVPVGPIATDTTHPEAIAQEEVVTAGTTAVAIETPVTQTTLSVLHSKQIEAKNNNEDFINRRR